MPCYHATFAFAFVLSSDGVDTSHLHFEEQDSKDPRKS